MNGYVISPMRSDELSFVASGFKLSLRHSAEFADKSNFEAFGVINPNVNRILAAYETLVAREGRKAVGFVTFLPAKDALVCAWIYVKQSKRHQGIAKALLAEAVERVPADAALEYVFPTSRWADLAADYGFQECQK